MICICLAEKNVDVCLQQLQKIELAEIRLDLVNFSDEDIKKVFSSGKKLVATCRPKQYPDEKQLHALKLAIESGAAYVDIEMEAPAAIKDEIIKVARAHSCDVIISYHNFGSTPETDQLNKMIEDMYCMGAHVAKVATMVNRIEDVAKILSLYSRGKRLVAIGMGEQGKLTRLMAPLLGAEFTFAALGIGQETAPGQIEIDKLVEAMNLIKKL